MTKIVFPKDHSYHLGFKTYFNFRERSNGSEEGGDVTEGKYGSSVIYILFSKAMHNGNTEIK